MHANAHTAPFRLLGYHRYITTDELAANYPFFPETQSRCTDKQVTFAWANPTPIPIPIPIPIPPDPDPGGLRDSTAAAESEPACKLQTPQLGSTSFQIQMQIADELWKRKREDKHNFARDSKRRKQKGVQASKSETSWLYPLNVVVWGIACMHGCMHACMHSPVHTTNRNVSLLCNGPETSVGFKSACMHAAASCCCCCCCMHACMQQQQQK